MNSQGFLAWLQTTDEDAPLSQYKTVLMGTAEYFKKLEGERDALKEELRLRRMWINAMTKINLSYAKMIARHKAKRRAR